SKQGGDLERAAEPAPHARRLVYPGDVLAAQHDAARRGGDRAGQHVDERGLARAVRADERVPRSRRQPEADVVGAGQRAEIFAELLCLESAGSHLSLIFSTMPRMPPRANSTTMTSSTPMPKYQYSGYCFAR